MTAPLLRATADPNLWGFFFFYSDTLALHSLLKSQYHFSHSYHAGETGVAPLPLLPPISQHAALLHCTENCSTDWKKSKQDFFSPLEKSHKIDFLVNVCLYKNE